MSDKRKSDVYMNFKEDLKVARELYKKSFTVIFGYILAFITIVGIFCVVFSFQANNTVVPDIVTFCMLFFLIISPMALSFKIISLRISVNQDIVIKDFYLGFKTSFTSWRLTFRFYIRNIILAILGFFIVFSILFWCYLTIYHPDFIIETNARMINSYQGASTYINEYFSENLYAIAPHITFLMFISFGVGVIIFSLFKIPRIIAIYMCLRAPFIPSRAIAYVNNRLSKSKLALFKINLIFIGWLIVSLIFSSGFYILFVDLNQTVALGGACLLLIAIYSFIIPLKYIFCAVVFRNRFNAEVMIMYQNEKERMARIDNDRLK